MKKEGSLSRSVVSKDSQAHRSTLGAVTARRGKSVAWSLKGERIECKVDVLVIVFN